jgi:hypothetical protein
MSGSFSSGVGFEIGKLMAEHRGQNPGTERTLEEGNMWTIRRVSQTVSWKTKFQTIFRLELQLSVHRDDTASNFGIKLARQMHAMFGTPQRVQGGQTEPLIARYL